MTRPYYTIGEHAPSEDPGRTEGTHDEQLLAVLRQRFPHGHPLFISILLDQMLLHSNKNHDYARGGDPLGNFKRVAAILRQWPGFPFDTPEGVAFIYALKQLDAEAWSMCQGGECKVEGLSGRTNDQAVYATIRQCMRTCPDGRAQAQAVEKK